MAKLQQEMGKLAREIHASLPPEKQGGFTDVYSEFRKGPNSRTLQRYAASSACVPRVVLSRTAYLSPFLCARARWLLYLEQDCHATHPASFYSIYAPVGISRRLEIHPSAWLLPPAGSVYGC
jgi:hypothetical protein